VNGYVWGQSDVRIKIQITNEREIQTYFGALNYQSLQFHVQSHPPGEGESTVKFIKYLQKKYKERKIILIWDGASYHKYGQRVLPFHCKVLGLVDCSDSNGQHNFWFLRLKRCTVSAYTSPRRNVARWAISGAT
jgi:hypothetical protein